jgi:hypothetical protein
MTMAALESSDHERVSARTNRAFERLPEPLRRQLKVHRYRMLGSCAKRRTRCKKPLCALGVALRASKEGRFALGRIRSPPVNLDAALVA